MVLGNHLKLISFSDPQVQVPVFGCAQLHVEASRFIEARAANHRAASITHEVAVDQLCEHFSVVLMGYASQRVVILINDH